MPRTPATLATTRSGIDGRAPYPAASAMTPRSLRWNEPSVRL